MSIIAHAHPYDALTPDRVLAALDQQGFVTDARIMALNSYENRVYQLGLEDGRFVVAKFYRPDRWSLAQIQEEHDFVFELADLEVPVVAPLRQEGRSIFHHQGFDFCVYPRQGGRAPDLESMDDLHVLGRLLGRMHLAASQKPFVHRPNLNWQQFGEQSVHALLSGDAVPEECRAAYEATALPLLAKLETLLPKAWPTAIRLHADCHLGNILWQQGAGVLVDFDDARMGPAVQDLWMLLTGTRADQQHALLEILEGYESFFPFDAQQLQWIEPLRCLRQLHYAAWLSRRWQDPAFKMGFPWFNTPSYWFGHINDLRELSAGLDEPPLSLRLY